jgi:hypothetical protein
MLTSAKTPSLMTNLQSSPGSIKQAHGPPPIKYKRTGDVLLRLQTTNFILLKGGNLNLFPPRAAIQSSSGDLRRNKNRQACIMVFVRATPRPARTRDRAQRSHLSGRNAAGTSTRRVRQRYLKNNK